MNSNPYWFYFESTGQIEAYLTYKEFLRLTSGKEENFDKQGTDYGNQSLWFDSTGNGLSGKR